MSNKIVARPKLTPVQREALANVWQCADLPSVRESDMLAEIVQREIG